MSFLALGPLAETCKSLRLLWLLLSLLCEFREDHATGPNSPLNTHSHSHRGTISSKSTLQSVNHSGLHEKRLHHTLSQQTTLLTNGFLYKISNFHQENQTPKNCLSVFCHPLMSVIHMCIWFTFRPAIIVQEWVQ